MHKTCKNQSNERITLKMALYYKDFSVIKL